MLGAHEKKPAEAGCKERRSIRPAENNAQLLLRSFRPLFICILLLTGALLLLLIRFF